MLGAWMWAAPAAVSERVVQVLVPAQVLVPLAPRASVVPVAQVEVSVEAVPVQTLSRRSFSAAMASCTT
jgi:hypothetical protein